MNKNNTTRTICCVSTVQPYIETDIYLNYELYFSTQICTATFVSRWVSNNSTRGSIRIFKKCLLSLLLVMFSGPSDCCYGGHLDNLLLLLLINQRWYQDWTNTEHLPYISGWWVGGLFRLMFVNFDRSKTKHLCPKTREINAKNKINSTT